jgi:hypothetical protein
MTLPTADPALVALYRHHERRADRLRFEAYRTTAGAKLEALYEEREELRWMEKRVEKLIAELEDNDGDE